MRAQSRRRDVRLLTSVAHERPLVRVKAFVQLEVDKLGELEGALLADVRFDSVVEPHVSFKIGGGAKHFMTLFASERFFA